MNLRTKDSLKVGTIMLIPILLVTFFMRTVFSIMDSFWRQAFHLMYLNRFYLSIFSIILTVSFVYLMGFVVTSPHFGRIIEKIPVARKIWRIAKKPVDRISFMTNGGYKQIIYEQFGKGSGRWKPAVVLGKTIFMNNDGTSETMLAVITPNVTLPDAVWIPPQDTRIVKNSFKDMVMFIASGGFVNPAILTLEKWTEEEIDTIPEYKSKDEE